MMISDSPGSAKVMISDGGSSGVGAPGPRPSSWISTLPSSATWPTCNFLMALSSAARGTGCVRLGRVLRCSMLRMWRFTASTISLCPPDEDKFLLIWDREQDGQSEDDAPSWSLDAMSTSGAGETGGEALTRRLTATKKNTANRGDMMGSDCHSNTDSVISRVSRFSRVSNCLCRSRSTCSLSFRVKSSPTQ